MMAIKGIEGNEINRIIIRDLDILVDCRYSKGYGLTKMCSALLVFFSGWSHVPSESFQMIVFAQLSRKRSREEFLAIAGQCER